MKQKFEVMVAGATARRLANIYKNLDYVTSNETVYTFKCNKDFKTNLKKVIYNNSKGEFFIGNSTLPDIKNNKIKSYKFLMALLNCYYKQTEQELKVLADCWLKHYKPMKIEIRDDIPTVYDMDIPGSCMVGNSEYYEDLQRSFKDNLKIAVIIKNDELLARALLWTGLKTQEGDIINLMDRIYSGSNSRIESTYKDWAKNNGYYTRKKQTYNSTTCFISPTGKEKELSLCLEGSLELCNYDYLPYLDTMKFFTEDGKVYNYGGADIAFTAIETNGEINSGNWSDYCGEYISDDDAVYSGLMEDYIYNDDAVYLDYCNDYIVEEYVTTEAVTLEGAIEDAVFYKNDITITIIDGSDDKLDISEGWLDCRDASDIIDADWVYHDTNAVYISENVCYALSREFEGYKYIYQNCENDFIDEMIDNLQGDDFIELLDDLINNAGIINDDEKIEYMERYIKNHN